MGSTQPMWVGLDLCDRLDCVEFFLTHHGGLGQKIPSTRPNPTHVSWIRLGWTYILSWIGLNFF